MDNSDYKRKQILEAAAKRFAHFGLSKTTMNDIAKDLSYSKALLYYYFPNKDELYIDVFIDIVEKMSAEIGTGMRKQTTVTDAIMYYLNKRQSFIIRYYKLFIQAPKTRQTQSPRLKEIYTASLQSEVGRIREILIKGWQRGEIILSDPQATAELFLSAISGLRFSSFQSTPASFPDLTQLEEIFAQQKQLALIFCKGLRVENVT